MADPDADVADGRDTPPEETKDGSANHPASNVAGRDVPEGRPVESAPLKAADPQQAMEDEGGSTVAPKDRPQS